MYCLVSSLSIKLILFLLTCTINNFLIFFLINNLNNNVIHQKQKKNQKILQLSLINLGAIWAGAADIPAFRSMRTLRALRPLRAVSRWEGMRVSKIIAKNKTI